MRRWRWTIAVAWPRPSSVNDSDLSSARTTYPSRSSRPTISWTVGAESCIARATLAPVIGSPASSSQNMIWRYSSSAGVAASLDTIPMVSPSACRQGRDHGLVEAVAHRALGHLRVREARERLSQRGVARRAVGPDEEAADCRGGVEVLERVPDPDAFGRV